MAGGYGGQRHHKGCSSLTSTPITITSPPALAVPVPVSVPIPVPVLVSPTPALQLPLLHLRKLLFRHGGSPPGGRHEVKGRCPDGDLGLPARQGPARHAGAWGEGSGKSGAEHPVVVVVVASVREGKVEVEGGGQGSQERSTQWWWWSVCGGGGGGRRGRWGRTTHSRGHTIKYRYKSEGRQVVRETEVYTPANCFPAIGCIAEQLSIHQSWRNVPWESRQACQACQACQAGHAGHAGHAHASSHSSHSLPRMHASGARTSSYHARATHTRATHARATHTRYSHPRHSHTGYAHSWNTNARTTHARTTHGASSPRKPRGEPREASGEGKGHARSGTHARGKGHAWRDRISGGGVGGRGEDSGVDHVESHVRHNHCIFQLSKVRSGECASACWECS